MKMIVTIFNLFFEKIEKEVGRKMSSFLFII